jgi:hypothetical protein
MSSIQSLANETIDPRDQRSNSIVSISPESFNRTMVQGDLDTIQAAFNKYGLTKGEQLCLYLLARNKDTGVSATVISRELAVRLKLKQHSEGLKIVIANNSPAQTVKVTEKVNIIVHGTLVRLPLVVHDLPKPHICLLGLDWIKQAKCVIDAVEQRIIFNRGRLAYVRTVRRMTRLTPTVFWRN